MKSSLTPSSVDGLVHFINLFLNLCCYSLCHRSDVGGWLALRIFQTSNLLPLFGTQCSAWICTTCWSVSCSKYNRLVGVMLCFHVRTLGQDIELEKQTDGYSVLLGASKSHNCLFRASCEASVTDL